MPNVFEIDSLVDRVYACVLDHEGWADVLTGCTRLVGGDSALVHVRSESDRGGALMTSRGFDPRYDVATYLSYYEMRSPLLGFYAERTVGRFRALGHYAFSAAYRNTEFFQDWVRPQGFADMLGAHLVRTPHLRAWMSIRRAESRHVYSVVERRTADQLAPHLARGLRLGAELAAQRRISHGVRDLLDLVGYGVFLVDAAGRILMSNRVGDVILRADDGLRSRHGRLVCERPDDAAALDRAIVASTRPAASDVGAFDVCVRRRQVERPLTVQVLPRASGSDRLGVGLPSGTAFVMVVDPLMQVANVGPVADAYGLTASERRVLHEIVQCGGVVEAAARLRVAVPTVRSHLQHIFEKTGVASQAALVRLVMSSTLRLDPAGRRSA